MTALSITFIVWGILTTGFVAVMVYRALLDQHETDQIFLNENASHNAEDEHDQIVARMNRTEPLLKGFAGAAALSTAALIGVFIASSV